ncbi:hypothetical protein Pth03_26860 [Planotetraspora thailandica]|uniref:Uncharacterized protein n=1 Tax=Planotetraspora thailandica TaxID=487172 RepID=A0A8J3V2F9_9ACTN|nr:hypothetical protein Pth03_26860 [Planotetraspora thailandica]
MVMRQLDSHETKHVMTQGHSEDSSAAGSMSSALTSISIAFLLFRRLVTTAPVTWGSVRW